MSAAGDWIPNEEIENAQIKWAFSHFDGRADTYNDEGDRNFTIKLSEEHAQRLMETGWNIKVMDGYEEGDPPEYLFKVKISYKFDPPKIYLIKGDRKIRAEERDLADITRATVENIDVVIKPHKWERQGNRGVSAYVEEMYVVVSQSRFAQRYQDLQEI